MNEFRVSKSEKQETLEENGCVFRGQELLDNHEIDPEKPCYCGRPMLGQVFIDCIGADNKKHVCEPHKDESKCGVKIKRKKLQPDDWKLLSCYECTY